MTAPVINEDRIHCAKPAKNEFTPEADGSSSCDKVSNGPLGYRYDHLKPVWPTITTPDLPSYIPIPPDRAGFADPSKGSLLKTATKVKYLTPILGVEFEGIDLRTLDDGQKDELALVVAEKGVAFFRNQPDFTEHDQLALGRYFGPLHKHAVAPMPQDTSMDELLVVYADKTSIHPASFRGGQAKTKVELWHSDVSYEEQPPGFTSLKGITIPPSGGDTIWCSGYAIYASLSPSMQTYLSTLYALHTGFEQASEARAANKTVRRQEIQTAHPVVRVHPVTGWKSVYVCPAVTTRIVGIPKVESDMLLAFLYRQMIEGVDMQVRFTWTENTVAIWDNRIVHHTAIFDFWPDRRHALRVTTTGEKPLSVEDYEKMTGKEAKTWSREMMTV